MSPPTPELKGQQLSHHRSESHSNAINLGIFCEHTSSVHAHALGESTRSCIAESGRSFTSTPSNATPGFGRSGNLVCMESGTSSGVICLFNSGLGGARKFFAVGLLGLSSFSSTESRFFRVSSSDASAWPNPCEDATCSIDLKYYSLLAI